MARLTSLTTLVLSHNKLVTVPNLSPSAALSPSGDAYALNSKTNNLRNLIRTFLKDKEREGKREKKRTDRERQRERQ